MTDVADIVALVDRQTDGIALALGLTAWNVATAFRSAPSGMIAFAGSGLPSLGSTWGHIESVGVLHHMASPRAGLS